jgi:feruloyl-CoA synthase
VRILRKVSPSKYLGVPKGVEVLLPYLQRDRELAESMFRDVKCTMFGGAPMPAHLLDALEAVQAAAVGERIVNVNGVGSTDAGPSALMANWHVGNRPIVGLPVAGMEAKIVPTRGKLELRLRGDAVMKGYWKDPQRTRDAFDDEGFFKIGDAITWLDPQDYAKGMVFNGRVVEDFKLSSGTWVNVGALRDALIAHAAPLVRDAVIAGHGGAHVAALVFLNIDACRAACPDLPASAPDAQIVAHARVREAVQKALDAFEPHAGSSSRVDRAVIEVEQPSLDNGEQTDKGSVSQRSVLERRSAVVAELLSDPPSERTIVRSR